MSCIDSYGYSTTYTAADNYCRDSNGFCKQAVTASLTTVTGFCQTSSTDIGCVALDATHTLTSTSSAVVMTCGTAIAASSMKCYDTTSFLLVT